MRFVRAAVLAILSMCARLASCAVNSGFSGGGEMKGAEAKVVQGEL